MRLNKNQLNIFLRYLILIIVITAIFILLFLFIGDNKKQINTITIIISATGIFIAVIVAFLFTKLFSEREKRIERKKRIDEYSNKVSALRRISNFLLNAHQVIPYPLRKNIETFYPNLKLLEFQQLGSEHQKLITEKVQGSEAFVTGYLALKEIEGKHPNLFWPINIGELITRFMKLIITQSTVKRLIVSLVAIIRSLSL